MSKGTSRDTPYEHSEQTGLDSYIQESPDFLKRMNARSLTISKSKVRRDAFMKTSAYASNQMTYETSDLSRIKSEHVMPRVPQALDFGKKLAREQVDYLGRRTDLPAVHKALKENSSCVSIVGEVNYEDFLPYSVQKFMKKQASS